MDTKEFFKKQYGISVPHSWCAYNGTNMVEFAEKYHQHRLAEKPHPIKIETMDSRTGKIYDEAELRKAFREPVGIPDHFIPVEEPDMTNKQKETKQVSKHDNKSKLGKKFTAARHQRKRFWHK